MCSKADAREAHEARAAAIERFDALTRTFPPPIPPVSSGTRAIGAIAGIFERAAATVPLVRRRKKP